MPVKMAKIGNSALLPALRRKGLLLGESSLNYLVCLGILAQAVNSPYEKPAAQFSLRGLVSYIPQKAREIYQEYF